VKGLQVKSPLPLRYDLWKSLIRRLPPWAQVVLSGMGILITFLTLLAVFVGADFNTLTTDAQHWKEAGLDWLACLLKQMHNTH
jgi:hypothetical protein